MTTQTHKGASAHTLLRLSGLAAIGAGLIFAGIQPVHPADVVGSVTTGPWSIILSLKLAMCLLMLIGISGIYLRQLGKIGWLGLAGFATRTSRVLLGTDIAVAAFHHPVRLAEDVALLDIMSNGRAVLGIAIGSLVRSGWRMARHG